MVKPEQKSNNVNAFESLVKVAAFGGVPILPLTSWYSLAPIQPIGGYWYFGFDCPGCRGLCPLFRDFSDGALGSPFTGCGIQTTCSWCKANVRCASEAIIPIRWPLAPGQIAPRSEYANRVARKYTQDPESKPLSGPLHHYTSFAALPSILKSKSFWATNIHYLEDSSESELGLMRMRQVAQEALATSSGIDTEILTYLIERLANLTSESASVYVLSMSKDRNKLSQWKGFTKYDEGVCISINSMQMVKRMQAQGWTFQSSRYNHLSQLSWAEAILSRIRREAATNYSGIEDEKRNVFDTVLESCMSELLQAAATIKHEAFVDESEVRFISPMIDISDGRVAYRARPGKTTRVPYIEFGLADDMRTLSIEEVMIGPGENQLRTKASVEVLLKENGVKFPWRVSLSDIPYRELP